MQRILTGLLALTALTIATSDRTARAQQTDATVGLRVIDDATEAVTGSCGTWSCTPLIAKVHRASSVTVYVHAAPDTPFLLFVATRPAVCPPFPGFIGGLGIDLSGFIAVVSGTMQRSSDSPCLSGAVRYVIPVPPTVPLGRIVTMQALGQAIESGPFGFSQPITLDVADAIPQ